MRELDDSLSSHDTDNRPASAIRRFLRAAADRRFFFKYALPAAAVLAIVGVVLKNAWTCDDAYITFRTADNFLHGLGLRWNPGERVQTYTHPLWMFLISGVIALSGEFYYSVIALSIVLTGAALCILFFGCRGQVRGILGVAAVLISSQAFIDYSTSGLENPLAHLFVVLFIAIYLSPDGTSERKALGLTLIAATAAVNRLDHILLYLPMLVGCYAGLSKRGIVRCAVPGFLPLVLWELFSLFYYGFPFPNTAYAKLNTGIDTAALLSQGATYFLYSLKNDPVTLAAMLLGVVVALMHRSFRHGTAAVGILLYCAYVWKIGGDFMAGRFFSVPLVAAVCLIAIAFKEGDKKKRRYLSWALLVLAATGIFGSRNHPARTDSAYRNQHILHGICNERGYYFGMSGLLNVLDGGREPFFRDRFYRRALKERQIGKERRRQNRRHVVLSPNVGIFGFKAGPLVHIFDSYALADPLFARLPSYKDPNWRIGHFRRLAPKGYRETLKGGVNVIEDKKLAAFYDKLRLIIEGDLLSSRRLLTVLEMNLGRYDHLIDRQFYRNLDPDEYRKKRRRKKR